MTGTNDDHHDDTGGNSNPPSPADSSPSSEAGSSSSSASSSSPGVVTRSMAAGGATTSGGNANNANPNPNRTNAGAGAGAGRARPPGPRRTSTADTAAMTGAATLLTGENSPREGGPSGGASGGTGNSRNRSNPTNNGNNSNPNNNNNNNNNNGRNVRVSPHNNAAAGGPPAAATVPGGQRVPSIARRSVSSGSGSDGGGGGGFGSGGGGGGGGADRSGGTYNNNSGPGGGGGPRRSARGPGPGMAPTGVNITTASAGSGGLAGSHSAPPAIGGGAGGAASSAASASASASRCLNPANEINSRLDAHVEVKVYPCNNNASSSSSQQNKKNKFTQFTIKPEGVIIQGANSRHRAAQSGSGDLGAEYAKHVGRKLRRYELSDTRACQLLVTTHGGSYWAVPAPEAFSRHSGTCRLLGDRKHPLASHTLQVGDFLRVGSVGVVVIETHDGMENKILSEEKIKKIIKDTTSSGGGFLDFGETEDENSDDSDMDGPPGKPRPGPGQGGMLSDSPTCYMCFDDEDTEENPLITPCKCRGDTRYVHVSCLRKWHTAEADNQICFLSSVDATCSVCKTTFKSDFRLKDGRTMKLFKSSLEPPYVSLLVATKHEMAQRLFNTRFQLSFSTLMKPDGKNGTRPLLLGRSSGSDMVLDYRTVSARHASIRFKNGEFIFTDAGSSNGSYLYLRRPVELTPQQPVQFRLGRSMISMKVNSKWNKRLLRTIRRGGTSSSNNANGEDDDHSVGSNEDDVRVICDEDGTISRTVPKRTRESIIESMPPPGKLLQSAPKHLDLLYALAYPRRQEKNAQSFNKQGSNVAAKNHQSFLTSLTGGAAPAPVALPALAAGNGDGDADADADEDANPDGEDSKMEDSSGRGAGAESSPSRRSEDSDELHDGDKDDDVMMVDEIVEDADDDGMDVEDGNVAPDEQVVEETLV
mmetsp:Transcript_15045/g.43472  ORF Transcript_15045/g.43472 Transcript_15045/m.43472 type:complete len:929 (+) Transcript_15045:202-2988(+)